MFCGLTARPLMILRGSWSLIDDTGRRAGEEVEGSSLHYPITTTIKVLILELCISTTRFPYGLGMVHRGCFDSIVSRHV